MRHIIREKIGNETDLGAVVGADWVEVKAGVNRGPAAPALSLRAADGDTLGKIDVVVSPGLSD